MAFSPRVWISVLSCRLSAFLACLVTRHTPYATMERAVINLFPFSSEKTILYPATGTAVIAAITSATDVDYHSNIYLGQYHAVLEGDECYLFILLNILVQ